MRNGDWEIRPSPTIGEEVEPGLFRAPIEGLYVRPTADTEAAVHRVLRQRPSGLIESVGTLDYGFAQDGTYRLVVNVDPAIVELYRALVPRWVRLNRQKHAPHMTLVRETAIPNPARWGRDHGAEVTFWYRREVQVGEVYYWLEAYCPELERLRIELGLAPTDWYTKPPDFADCFHITIGNTKR